jgi:hypothetical protein
MTEHRSKKQKATAYRELAADRAKLAAKYAKAKDYELAARWYNAAHTFMRIADEFDPL